MTTTALLRTRIADELNRQPSETLGTGLSVGLAIERSINASIRHYESMRTAWGEVRDVLLAVTVQGQRYYSLSNSNIQFLSIDSAKSKYNDSYIHLNRRSWDEIDKKDRQISTSHGVPQDFTVYARQVRLWPVPSVSISVLVSGIQRPLITSLTGSYTGTESSSPTSTASHNNRTGGWYDEGHELIKARAMALMKTSYLRDRSAREEMALLAARGKDFLSVEEMSAYNALRDETNDYLTTGKIKPYCL